MMTPSELPYRVSPSMWRGYPIRFLLCLALCCVFVGIPILLLWWLYFRAISLTIDEEKTSLAKGLLSRQSSDVFHSDVRNVQVTKTLFDRIMGVGTIAISSAGQAGMEIAVSGIPHPEAVRDLVYQLRRDAGGQPG